MFLLHPYREVRWQLFTAIRIHLFSLYLPQFNNEPFLLPSVLSALLCGTLTPRLQIRESGGLHLHLLVTLLAASEMRSRYYSPCFAPRVKSVLTRVDIIRHCQDPSPRKMCQSGFTPLNS
jgi:hypothetical protein